MTYYSLVTTQMISVRQLVIIILLRSLEMLEMASITNIAHTTKPLIPVTYETGSINHRDALWVRSATDSRGFRGICWIDFCSINDIMNVLVVWCREFTIP